MLSSDAVSRIGHVYSCRQSALRKAELREQTGNWIRRGAVSPLLVRITQSPTVPFAFFAFSFLPLLVIRALLHRMRAVAPSPFPFAPGPSSISLQSLLSSVHLPFLLRLPASKPCRRSSSRLVATSRLDSSRRLATSCLTSSSL